MTLYLYAPKSEREAKIQANNMRALCYKGSDERYKLCEKKKKMLSGEERLAHLEVRDAYFI
jgi:hypothetical protein